MSLSIRPYHPSDLCDLYRICLQTGANGEDASTLYRDPLLLGHFYAAPYAVLDPTLCFVLTMEGTPCGYVLGTRDHVAFSEACERAWLPVLRERYPLPPRKDDSRDAQLIRMIHEGHTALPELRAYPADLHINLLPVVQGKGWGRRLMACFLDQLRTDGVPAVHLGVSDANRRAIAFQPVADFGNWIAYGMQLDSKTPAKGAGNTGSLM